MALKAAVERVIEEHVREGLSLYIWRDGRVVEVPPEELRAVQAVNQAEARSPSEGRPCISEGLLKL
jgi:hypothetical protein